MLGKHSTPEPHPTRHVFHWGSFVGHCVVWITATEDRDSLSPRTVSHLAGTLCSERPVTTPVYQATLALSQNRTEEASLSCTAGE